MRLKYGDKKNRYEISFFEYIQLLLNLSETLIVEYIEANTNTHACARQV